MPKVPATLPYSPAEYRHGFFNWRNMTKETGEFRYEKVTENGFADVGRVRYDARLEKLVPVSQEMRALAMTHLSMGDVNNDGLFDILAVGTDYGLGRSMSELTSARFWRNLGNFQFEEATAESGLDTLHKSYREWHEFFGDELSPAAERFDVSRTRINRVQPGLEAGPVVDASPRYAYAELIGARVEVRQPGGTGLIAMRGIYSNHNYRSNTALEAHFGLGRWDAVDVDINLPDGRVIGFGKLAADRLLDIDLEDRTLTELPTASPTTLQADPGSSKD